MTYITQLGNVWWYISHNFLQFGGWAKAVWWDMERAMMWVAFGIVVDLATVVNVNGIHAGGL